MTSPSLVTIAVPSFNQGEFLDCALESIFHQDVPVEVFVADGGSTDTSLEVIGKWEGKLAGWRSHPDSGQSAAINEAISKGNAPYVCWLNSDDWLLPGALEKLVRALESNPNAGMAYSRVRDYFQERDQFRPGWVRSFSEWWFAQYCFISQPGTLVRREAWELLGGLNEELHMAMDYDLWWRLYRTCGQPVFVDDYVAVNRVHGATKTKTQRRKHYIEAMAVVRKYYGRVPLKWWLAQPYAVWYRSLIGR
ncbi:MAG: glycosyltransferase [Hydrogenophilales bacterium]|nr:glycosyltransferase [Hydrogenophilales bacterium]